MSMMTGTQFRAWFDTSLQVSGLRSLAEGPLQFWKYAVKHGHSALPPGFLGVLYERLTGQSAGTKVQAIPLRAATEFLGLILEHPGIEHLEGLFALQGRTLPNNFVDGVLFQLLERLPHFSHPRIQVSSSVIEEALAAGCATDTAFPAQSILQELYQRSITQLRQTPLQLDAHDLFEIAHPDLFIRPADRTFFRVLTQAMSGIAPWATATFTLHEESSSVVARYGEPQMLRLGGYGALTNRGTIASLVPSELGFIDEELEVDLFDYKYCENQLLYFEREDGAVFRIRRRIIVPVRMTALLEHERNLGLFFGWLLVLAEKIIEVFSKDIVWIYFELSGHRPSALNEAIRFLRHFLCERQIDDQIRLYLDPDRAPRPNRGYISREDNQRRTRRWVNSLSPADQKLVASLVEGRFSRFPVPIREEMTRRLNLDLREVEEAYETEFAPEYGNFGQSLFMIPYDKDILAELMAVAGRGKPVPSEMDQDIEIDASDENGRHWEDGCIRPVIGDRVVVPEQAMASETKPASAVSAENAEEMMSSGEAQWWILGPRPEQELKHVVFEFPQTDEFVEADAASQERWLGEAIVQALTAMVEHAHR